MNISIILYYSIIISILIFYTYYVNTGKELVDPILSLWEKENGLPSGKPLDMTFAEITVNSRSWILYNKGDQSQIL